MGFAPTRPPLGGFHPKKATASTASLKVSAG
jgi:hypothetical protein